MIYVTTIDSDEIIQIKLTEDGDMNTLADLIEQTCNNNKFIHFISVNDRHYIISTDKIVKITIY